MNDLAVRFFDEEQIIHYSVFDKNGKYIGRKREIIGDEKEYFKRKLKGK